MFAAPIIGAGINLLGGLFGRRSARKAEKRQRAMAIQDQAEQFVRLRDAAEKAGFNPLTALQANPTGGMVNPTPALASGQFVADALGSATSTYFNMKQQERDIERDALEKALMREELKAMQMQGKALEKRMQFGYEIPQANNYSGVDRANASPALASGAVDTSVPRGHAGVTEPIDLFVPYRRRDGTIVYGPNPDAGDAEQLVAAGILEGAAGVKAPFLARPKRNPLRPQTPEIDLRNDAPKRLKTSFWDFYGAQF